jgi:hypothetical protein
MVADYRARTGGIANEGVIVKYRQGRSAAEGQCLRRWEG